MVLKKGNMIIPLEDNIDKLYREIEELLKVKQMLTQSPSYKLLYGKTQATEEREFEAIRSRLEHSQNISQISQSIVAGIYDTCATEEQKNSEIFVLNRKKELLYTEICALSHDLGHTPFGHEGERTINHFMQNLTDSDQIHAIIEKRIKCFGEDYEITQGHIGDDVTLSFEHNEQSALIFYDLLHHNSIDLEHIDSNRIIAAILAHSTTRVPECPNDLVAQVIRHTDKIEYRNMDFDELGKYIKSNRFSDSAFAKSTSEERIKQIVSNLIIEAIDKGKIDDEMDSLGELKQLRKSYENAIYFLNDGTKGLLTSENIVRNRLIVQKLLAYYYKNPEQIHTKYYTKVTPLNSSVQEPIHSVYDSLKSKNSTNIEKAINFILSMDNKRIQNQYLRLVKQRIVTGEGVEPITREEFETVRLSQEEEKIEQFRAKEFSKSNQPHTIQEIRNIVRARDKKFVQEMLTPEGISAMENTKRKIDRDAKMDLALCEQMEQADLARKYKRDVSFKMSPELSQNTKRHQAAMKVKENWKYQFPTSPGEDEDGPGGR